MTRERLAPEMIELIPDLARFVPPAAVIDKAVYSPWLGNGHQVETCTTDDILRGWR